MKTLKCLFFSAVIGLSAGYSTDSNADGGTAYFDTMFEANMFCNQYTICNITQLSTNLFKAVYEESASDPDPEPGTGGGGTPPGGGPGGVSGGGDGIYCPPNIIACMPT